MKLRGKILLGVLTICLLFLMSCGNAGNKQEAPKEKQEAPKEEKMKIRVGVEADYPPYTFTDQSGKMTGYDVEVLEEIGKRKNFDVEFLVTPWDGMFLGLEAEKFDLLTDLSKSPEREQKYDFTDEYLVSGPQIIVKKGRTDIQKVDDFKGKKIMSSVGSEYNELLKKYNKDEQFKIVYYDGDVTVAFDEIVQGRADATINDRLTAGYFIKQKGDIIELVGDPIERSTAHMIVRKNDNKLKEAINEGLKEMKADGTLAKLSEKWFGADYTK